MDISSDSGYAFAEYNNEIDRSLSVSLNQNHINIDENSLEKQPIKKTNCFLIKCFSFAAVFLLSFFLSELILKEFSS
jgi:hypothetical protein